MTYGRQNRITRFLRDERDLDVVREGEEVEDKEGEGVEDESSGA